MSHPYLFSVYEGVKGVSRIKYFTFAITKYALIMIR